MIPKPCAVLSGLTLGVSRFPMRPRCARFAICSGTMTWASQLFEAVCCELFLIPQQVDETFHGNG